MRGNNKRIHSSFELISLSNKDGRRNNCHSIFRHLLPYFLLPWDDGYKESGNIWQLYPDSKVHGTNMGPIWGRQDPGGPHVGPMNFVIWVSLVVIWDDTLLIQTYTKTRYLFTYGQRLVTLFPYHDITCYIKSSPISIIGVTRWLNSAYNWEELFPKHSVPAM